MPDRSRTFGPGPKGQNRSTVDSVIVRNRVGGHGKVWVRKSMGYRRVWVITDTSGGPSTARAQLDGRTSVYFGVNHRTEAMFLLLRHTCTTVSIICIT